MNKFYSLALVAAVGLSASAAAPRATFNKVHKERANVEASRAVNTQVENRIQPLMVSEAAHAPSALNAAQKAAAISDIYGYYRFISFSEMYGEYEMYALEISEGEGENEVIISNLLDFGSGEVTATYDEATGELTIPNESVIYSSDTYGDVVLVNSVYDWVEDDFIFLDEDIVWTYDAEAGEFEFPEDYTFFAYSIDEAEDAWYWAVNGYARLLDYEPGDAYIPYSSSGFSNYITDAIYNSDPFYIYIDEESGCVTIDGIGNIGPVSSQDTYITPTTLIQGVYDELEETITLTNLGYYIAVQTYYDVNLYVGGVYNGGYLTYDDVAFVKDEDGEWVLNVEGLYVGSSVGGFNWYKDLSLRPANASMEYYNYTYSMTISQPCWYGFNEDKTSLEISSIGQIFGMGFPITWAVDGNTISVDEAAVYGNSDKSYYLKLYATDFPTEVEGTISGNTIAFPSNNPEYSNYWSALDSDNYYWGGYNSQAIITIGSDENSGIGSVAVDNSSNANAPVEYYNLQGMKIAEPAAGKITIVKKGSDVSKQIIR